MRSSGKKGGTPPSRDAAADAMSDADFAAYLAAQEGEQGDVGHRAHAFSELDYVKLSEVVNVAQRTPYYQEPLFYRMHAVGDGNCSVNSFALGLIHLIQCNALNLEPCYPVFLNAIKNTLPILKDRLALYQGKASTLHGNRFEDLSDDLAAFIHFIEQDPPPSCQAFMAYVNAQKTLLGIGALHIGLAPALRALGSPQYSQNIQAVLYDDPSAEMGDYANLAGDGVDAGAEILPELARVFQVNLAMCKIQRCNLEPITAEREVRHPYTLYFRYDENKQLICEFIGLDNQLHIERFTVSEETLSPQQLLDGLLGALQKQGYGDLRSRSIVESLSEELVGRPRLSVLHSAAHWDALVPADDMRQAVGLAQHDELKQAVLTQAVQAPPAPPTEAPWDFLIAQHEVGERLQAMLRVRTRVVDKDREDRNWPDIKKNFDLSVEALNQYAARVQTLPDPGKTFLLQRMYRTMDQYASEMITTMCCETGSTELDINTLLDFCGKASQAPAQGDVIAYHLGRIKEGVGHINQLYGLIQQSLRPAAAAPMAPIAQQVPVTPAAATQTPAAKAPVATKPAAPAAQPAAAKPAAKAPAAQTPIAAVPDKHSVNLKKILEDSREALHYMEQLRGMVEKPPQAAEDSLQMVMEGVQQASRDLAARWQQLTQLVKAQPSNKEAESCLESITQQLPVFDEHIRALVVALYKKSGKHDVTHWKSMGLNTAQQGFFFATPLKTRSSHDTETYLARIQQGAELLTVLHRDKRHETAARKPATPEPVTTMSLEELERFVEEVEQAAARRQQQEKPASVAAQPKLSTASAATFHQSSKDDSTKKPGGSTPKPNKNKK